MTVSHLEITKELPAHREAPEVSKFRQIRNGNLNRFYTRHAIGDILVSQLDDIAPRKVLDLGAGEGSLSAAIARRWGDAEIVTVDIDPEAAAGMHENIVSSGSIQHTHYIHDVFDTHLPHILRSHGSFDVAICNPPFFRPKWRSAFSGILSNGDLLGACPSIADINAESIFLAQNLRMVRNGGVIAMILPDGILTGWKTKPLRQHLLTKHRIDCVLQLPRHSFHDTEARCFILFLTKGVVPAKQIKLLRYDADCGLLEPIFITPHEAEQRLDYDYHSHSNQEDEKLITLRQMGADIKRGSISTVEAKSITFPVFHTSDFSSSPEGKIHFGTMPPIDSRVLVAEPGDILMARVDRNLHQKIAIVSAGRSALTDCVYRIRLTPEYRKAAFNAMCSASGRAKILAATKGVGARLIGKADLLNVPFGMSEDISLFTEELF